MAERRESKSGGPPPHSKTQAKHQRTTKATFMECGGLTPLSTFVRDWPSLLWLLAFAALRFAIIDEYDFGKVCLLMRVRVFAFMVIAAGACAGQTPSGAETGIEGIITITPTQAGPVRDDIPASRPLANANFAVENEKGEVASFTTDDQGHFRSSVPPGHYKVSMKGRKSTIGRFGPFEVDVVAGKMTNVQWQCDSGIR